MRNRDALWRLVAGVPVVLVTAMENEAQIGRDDAANHHASIHHSCDLLEPCGQFHAIGGRVESMGRCSVHRPSGVPTRYGYVALGVESIRLRHATAHPQQDDRVSRRYRARFLLAPEWFRTSGGERRCREGCLSDEENDGAEFHVSSDQLKLR